MKVLVLGQTWEASVTGGWLSATDYTIPDDTPPSRWELRHAINQKASDFWIIEDFSVPDLIDWARPDSADIYDSCMYPDMEAEG